MSDTPRTDAALKVLSNIKILYSAWNDASFISEFARQLERELAALRSDNLTAHKMACAAGIERDTLRAELAATQHLLHESLGREDRFYRELAAKSAVTTDHVVGTD